MRKEPVTQLPAEAVCVRTRCGTVALHLMLYAKVLLCPNSQSEGIQSCEHTLHSCYRASLQIFLIINQTHLLSKFILL